MAGLVLAGCATPKAVTTVAPKPNVSPVRQSNAQLKEHVKAIQKSNQEATKTNKGIGDDIESADEELQKLLKQ